MKNTIKVFAMISIFSVIAFTGCKKDETQPDEPAPSPVVYTNFKITNVKITAMPFVDGSSASWDISNGPDVFFNMEDASSNVLFDGSGSTYNDISAGSLPLAWNFVTAYAITNTGVFHNVTVYDYDSLDPDDLIGYVEFKMDDHKSGYPTSISKSNGSLSVTITGSWY